MSTTILVLDIGLEHSSSPYEYTGKGKVKKLDGDPAKTMTVGQLKAILSKHPDDAELWMGDSIGSYLSELTDVKIQSVTVEDDELSGGD